MTKPYNRYADPEEDEFLDDEMDRFMEMSEAEIDAEMEVSSREYAEVMSQVTVKQFADMRRRDTLRRCISNRHMLKQHPGWTLFEGFLKDSQIMLLKIREYRKTGQWPAGD